MKKGQRGPYKKCTEEDKRKAIELAFKLRDTNSAAKILDIPIKNLKRWIKQGYIRKKGGRKTQDPIMENELK